LAETETHSLSIEQVSPPADAQADSVDAETSVNRAVETQQAPALIHPGDTQSPVESTDPVLVEHPVRPGKKVRSVISEERSQKSNAGRRYEAALGAIGGAALPLFVLLMRLSEAAPYGGFPDFAGLVFVSGSCILPSATMGALFGLTGGLVGDNIYQKGDRSGDAGKSRLIYTLIGGAAGAVIALLLGLCPALLLMAPG
jgi:hypothetical protein